MILVYTPSLPLYLKCFIPYIILVYTPPLPCTYYCLAVTMGTSAQIMACPWSDTSSGTSSGHLLSETSAQITACTFFCGNTWSCVSYRKWGLLLYLPLCYRMLTHILMNKYLLARVLITSFVRTPDLLWATGKGFFWYTQLFVIECWHTFLWINICWIGV